MPDGPHVYECPLSEARFLQLAESARTPEERQALLALAETWKCLSAEIASEEALLETFVDMELVKEPWNDLPEALHLRSSGS
jgi:hypothetical protein